MSAARVRGQVRIVGAGLLGASIGLALRERELDVILADTSRANLSLAIDYGAGRARCRRTWSRMSRPPSCSRTPTPS
jgi:prephenate dehydrogenase